MGRIQNSFLIIFDGYSKTPPTQITDNERTALALIERGMAVPNFVLYEDFLNDAEEVKFKLYFEEDVSKYVIPTMEKFEKLGKIFFSHPFLAKIAAKLLPGLFINNAISGYLMPLIMRLGLTRYMISILIK